MYRKTLIQADKNSPELPDLIPKRDLTCPLPIVIAAAVVNPAVTGIEINCTIKPKNKNLIKKCLPSVKPNFIIYSITKGE